MLEKLKSGNKMKTTKLIVDKVKQACYRLSAKRLVGAKVTHENNLGPRETKDRFIQVTILPEAIHILRERTKGTDELTVDMNSNRAPTRFVVLYRG